MVMTEPIIQSATEFWYRFDNDTAMRVTKEIEDLYIGLRMYIPNPNAVSGYDYDFDWIWRKLFNYYRNFPAVYEQLFYNDIRSYADPLIRMAKYQKRLMLEYFKNLDEIKQGFELFGQGILYDERRRTVHQMDGTGPLNYVGYVRWHGFIRSISLLNVDLDFWLDVDRMLVLSYALQSYLKPVPTQKQNPPIDDTRLNSFRESTKSLRFNDIDGYFSSKFF